MDKADWIAAADETERVYGTPDLLIQTAGISNFGPIEAQTYEDGVFLIVPYPSGAKIFEEKQERWVLYSTPVGMQELDRCAKTPQTKEQRRLELETEGYNRGLQQRATTEGYNREHAIAVSVRKEAQIVCTLFLLDAFKALPICCMKKP